MTEAASAAVPPNRGRRFDLIIFDCDGVLVDSEILSIRLDVQLLAQLGWPLAPEEIIERWLGKTDAAMRAEIEDHLGRDIGDEWVAFSDRYVRAFAEELQPVDGAAEAVDAIQAAGYATCVASSGDLGKIRRNLAKTGLRERFGDRLFSDGAERHLSRPVGEAQVTGILDRRARAHLGRAFVQREPHDQGRPQLLRRG